MTSPAFPVVLASPGDGGFAFRCPRCQRRLAVRRVDYEQVYACTECQTQFQLTTARRREDLRRAQALRQSLEAEKLHDLKQRAEGLIAAGKPPRNRISILGRPQSGKSVFLAALYRQLWTATDDLRGRTHDGLDHQALLADYEELRQGRWLPSTQKLSRRDILLDYHGLRLPMTTMDYPGEVYRQLFFENRLDTEEQRELFEQVQSSMAVMLFVDPEAAIERTPDTLDLEFSCVQVVEHLQSAGLADNLLIVLTKRDRNRDLVKRLGGPREFLHTVMPRLSSLMPSMLIVHLSTVRTVEGDDGRPAPHVDEARLDHVRLPLRKLLARIGDDHLTLLSTVDDLLREQLPSTVMGVPLSTEEATHGEVLTEGVELLDRGHGARPGGS